MSHAGLRVPADCSVIGFDDAPLAAFCTPGLTTVRQPMEDMGAVATAWILKATQANPEEAGLAPIHMLAPVVVERDSTRPPGPCKVD